MEREKANKEFQWFIQDVCNYRCPYCYVSGELRKDGPWLPNLHPMPRWIEAWERVFLTHGHCKIMITGGEPTIVPEFTRMAAAVTRWHSISFDTNLSWSFADLEDFCSKASKKRTTVNVSFHPHTVSAESVIEKAAFLRDHDFDYVCRLVAFPPLVTEIAGHWEKFDRAGLRFMVHPFIGSYEGRDYPQSYTREEREIIAAAKDRFAERAPDDTGWVNIAGHLLNIRTESPAGKLCRSGQVYCRILNDGTVHRCQPYEENSWEPLGNFLDENFKLRDTPAVCRSAKCEWEYVYLA